MTKPKRTPREEIERAFHVSFKLPEQAAELLDAYRDQVLTEGADLIAAKRNAVHAACDRQTADGMDRARKLILNARTNQER